RSHDQEVRRLRVENEQLFAAERPPAVRALRLERDVVRGASGPAIPQRERSARLAERERREVALALLVGSRRLQRERREGVREERPGRKRVSKLLHEHHQLDRAEALSFVVLGHDEPGPVEAGGLAPDLLAEAGFGLAEPADRLRREARREKLPRRALEHSLLVGEIEVHEYG